LGYSEIPDIRATIGKVDRNWIKIGPNSYSFSILQKDIGELVDAVRQGHQPWRLEAIPVILVESGLGLLNENQVTIERTGDMYPIQTYKVSTPKYSFLFDLVDHEKVLFPVSMYFSQTSKSYKYGLKGQNFRGVISRVDFPGPPNFSSILDGDQKQTYWILTVSEAVSVDANSELDIKEQNVISIQLVFLSEDSDSYKKYDALVGKEVEVTGDLFHGFTAGHKTRLLISVENIRKTRI
jgi:hypothetical protein